MRQFLQLNGALFLASGRLLVRTSAAGSNSQIIHKLISFTGGLSRRFNGLWRALKAYPLDREAFDALEWF